MYYLKDIQNINLIKNVIKSNINKFIKLIKSINNNDFFNNNFNKSIQSKNTL